MLETDCMIPYKPVPIPRRDFYALHGIALSVKSLMDDGLTKWAIIKKLRISEDAYNDAVYEINRQTAVNEMNGECMIKEYKKYSYAQVKEMLAHGMKQIEIAKAIGISKARVSQIVKMFKSEKENAQMEINEDFDAAVDQMIAESKPQEIVQADKPVEMTEEHTVTVPDAVMQAVIDKIETLSAVLSDNLLTIKKMQQENENLRSELAVLYRWRAEHEGAEN